MDKEDMDNRLPESKLGGRSFSLGFLSMLTLAGMVGSLFYIQGVVESHSRATTSSLVPFGIFFLATLVLGVLGVVAGARSLFLRDHGKTLGFAGIGINLAVLATLGALSALFWEFGGDLLS